MEADCGGGGGEVIGTATAGDSSMDDDVLVVDRSAAVADEAESLPRPSLRIAIQSPELAVQLHATLALKWCKQALAAQNVQARIVNVTHIDNFYLCNLLVKDEPYTMLIVHNTAVGAGEVDGDGTYRLFLSAVPEGLELIVRGAHAVPTAETKFSLSWLGHDGRKDMIPPDIHKAVRFDQEKIWTDACSLYLFTNAAVCSWPNFPWLHLFLEPVKRPGECSTAEVEYLGLGGAGMLCHPIVAECVKQALHTYNSIVGRAKRAEQAVGGATVDKSTSAAK
jgi:hypothetical protein